MECTRKVFQEIKKARPTRIYIASDGARSNNKKEAEKVQLVRDFVTQNIDWECRIKTLFRDKNLGCGKAVSEAITWFFENEEMGIILEDDCLPNPSFFTFCEVLLNRYKDNFCVGHIGGNNFQDGIKRGCADYYFSQFSYIWGWATWANRWKNYDFSPNKDNCDKLFLKLFNDKRYKKYWERILKFLENKKIDTWDYQWLFTLWRNDMLSIVPNKNLVSNIGFGDGTAHTTDKEHENSSMQSHFIILKTHPTKVEQNKIADELYLRRICPPIYSIFF